MIVLEKKNAEAIIIKLKFNKNLSIFLCGIYRTIIIDGVIAQFNKKENLYMPEPFDYSVVDAALEKCGCKQSAIIAILQTIQEHYHYLPEEARRLLTTSFLPLRQYLVLEPVDLHQ